MEEIKYKHKIPVQVRFADMDKMGHVNNAVYHTYFELARVVYFNEVVGERVDWNVKGMILANANVDFKIPVKLNDELYCYTAVSRMGNKSFVLSNKLVIVKDGKESIAASALYTIVCMNYQTEQTIPVPSEWKEALNRFEGSSF